MNEKLEYVRRLVFKAENDLRSAQILSRTSGPATDVVCFHCQQAVEKMLKAFLHWHEISYPRTHNLTEVLTLCIRIEPGFAELQDIDTLTPYAVELRYAEEFYLPTTEEMQTALALAERTRQFVRARFEDLGVDPAGEFFDSPSS